MNELTSTDDNDLPTRDASPDEFSLNDRLHDASDPTGVSLDGFPSCSDPDGLAACERLDVLATMFTQELRAGADPSIDAYAHRYKDLAKEIRELFPLVETLERCRVDKQSDTFWRTFPSEFPIQQFGGYRIVRELGRGGMGIVFEAIETGIMRSVAIKLLPWRFRGDRPQRAEQLRREAATIAQLRHRNIVPVYSFGQHDGYWYYVMHFVAGVSLDWVVRRLKESYGQVTADEIRRFANSGSQDFQRTSEAENDAASRPIGRDSWTAFARMGVQVAQALAYAHREGVLHNDIKPANLLLDATGRVFVTDFGVGMHWTEGAADPDDQPVGTLRYMAPERLNGQRDERSDVYSLGVTLYELVTRVPPYTATNRRELIELTLKGSPRPPHQLAPQLPAALETIILRAMAKEPSERYASANELAADLLRFLKGQPIQTPGPGVLSRLMDWCRPRGSRPPRPGR